tara:strand:+ start:3131 stop:3946 length:816 start_codon:yes stop_codon:yes gene_type:complete
MKNFAVIGNPIEHSMSPILHNWIFKKLMIKAQYSKILVELNNLPRILENIRNSKLHGINVTIPYKEQIINFIDDINPRAKEIGSINCIMYSQGKLVGNNTDWFGFSKALINNKISIQNRDVIVLGAGGTAKSIIYASKQLGARSIKIANRTLDNAKRLEDNFVKIYSLDRLDEIIQENSIIINTTSVGMNKENLLFNLNLITQNQTLIDVIYNPVATPLIKQGEIIGAKTLNGLDMFIFQGFASLDLWFGEDISNQVNFTEIKTYLEKHIC